MKLDCSIIVNSYNKTTEQIIECFNSIREQTIAPREIIFVDDCSDEPHPHADAISIILPKNMGVATARDIGVHMSKGALLLFLDADDKLSPDFLEQCSRITLTHEIAYPNQILFGDVERNLLVEAPDEITPEYLLGKTLRLVVTSMMHRRVYETLGGFRDLPVYEDWDFWIRAMCNGYTFKKANTLLWYRQSKGSRNQVTQDMRANIHKEITAPYEIREGRLCTKSVTK